MCGYRGDEWLRRECLAKKRMSDKDVVVWLWRGCVTEEEMIG